MRNEIPYAILLRSLIDVVQDEKRDFPRFFGYSPSLDFTAGEQQLSLVACAGKSRKIICSTATDQDVRFGTLVTTLGYHLFGPGSAAPTPPLYSLLFTCGFSTNNLPLTYKNTPINNFPLIMVITSSLIYLTLTQRHLIEFFFQTMPSVPPWTSVNSRMLITLFTRAMHTHSAINCNILSGRRFSWENIQCQILILIFISIPNKEPNIEREKCVEIKVK